MNKDISSFFDQFTPSHVLKHSLLTVGLTVFFGPGGGVIGLLYCLGDSVSKSKEFTDKDMAQFLQSLSPQTLESLRRMAEKK